MLNARFLPIHSLRATLAAAATHSAAPSLRLTAQLPRRSLHLSSLLRKDSMTGPIQEVTELLAKVVPHHGNKAAAAAPAEGAAAAE